MIGLPNLSDSKIHRVADGRRAASDSEQPAHIKIARIFDAIYQNGKGDPRQALDAFKELHPDTAYLVSIKALEVISRLGNRALLLEFYQYCFSLPIFNHFENDNTMLRNLESTGFAVEYKNHKPLRVIDTKISEL